MRFQDSRLCNEHGHCTICRQLEKGRDWRTLAARIYEVPCVDFECPFGIRWLQPNESVVIGEFKVQPNVDLPKDDRSLGELALKLDATLREKLPATSPIIAGLNRFSFETRHSKGCTGCARKRLVGQLGQSVRSAPREEQAIMSELARPA